MLPLGVCKYNFADNTFLYFKGTETKLWICKPEPRHSHTTDGQVIYRADIVTIQNSYINILNVFCKIVTPTSFKW